MDGSRFDALARSFARSRNRRQVLGAIAAGALGLALHYGVLHVGALQPYAFLLVAGAWLLLILGTALRAL